jgi:predicted nuclease with TOPRIM domain
MAEGAELSVKQAALEASIKKLRGKVKELDNDKERLQSKLDVEQARVESIKTRWVRRIHNQ